MTRDEEDLLLRDLHALRPQGPAPAPPALRTVTPRRWAVPATLALAAALLLSVVGLWTLNQGDVDPVTLKGPGDAPDAPEVDLRLTARVDGQTTRVPEASTLDVGAEVVFWVSVTGADALTLTVSGPMGEQQLGPVPVAAELAPLGTAAGEDVAYVFATPGHYTITARAEGAVSCPGAGCVVRGIEVR
ncbi:MAG: hypothetical protein H6739_23260 [Alphaproteobacteria bacterium]|nr:hypothetical protein [Alphaproteobacteria bacterium]